MAKIIYRSNSCFFNNLVHALSWLHYIMINIVFSEMCMQYIRWQLYISIVYTWLRWFWGTPAIGNNAITLYKETPEIQIYQGILTLFLFDFWSLLDFAWWPRRLCGWWSWSLSLQISQLSPRRQPTSMQIDWSWVSHIYLFIFIYAQNNLYIQPTEL